MKPNSKRQISVPSSRAYWLCPDQDSSFLPLASAAHIWSRNPAHWFAKTQFPSSRWSFVFPYASSRGRGYPSSNSRIVQNKHGACFLGDEETPALDPYLSSPFQVRNSEDWFAIGHWCEKQFWEGLGCSCTSPLVNLSKFRGNERHDGKSDNLAVTAVCSWRSDRYLRM